MKTKRYVKKLYNTKKFTVISFSLVIFFFIHSLEIKSHSFKILTQLIFLYLYIEAIK